MPMIRAIERADAASTVRHCSRASSAALVMLLALAGCDGRSAPPAQRAGATITLTSTAFADGAAIPKRYARAGEDVSPPLAWTDVPAGAKELALICEDPDAPDPADPRPDPWVHWVVYKIPASAAGMPEAIPREA